MGSFTTDHELQLGLVESWICMLRSRLTPPFPLLYEFGENADTVGKA
jgi:hypothetical protein